MMASPNPAIKAMPASNGGDGTSDCTASPSVAPNAATAATALKEGSVHRATPRRTFVHICPKENRKSPASVMGRFCISMARNRMQTEQTRTSEAAAENSLKSSTLGR